MKFTLKLNVCFRADPWQPSPYVNFGVVIGRNQWEKVSQKGKIEITSINHRVNAQSQKKKKRLLTGSHENKANKQREKIQTTRGRVTTNVYLRKILENKKDKEW